MSIARDFVKEIDAAPGVAQEIKFNLNLLYLTAQAKVESFQQTIDSDLKEGSDKYSDIFLNV